jgi:hypothetical protein
MFVEPFLTRTAKADGPPKQMFVTAQEGRAMTTKSITSPITKGQKQSLIRIVDEAGNDVLERMGYSRGEAQKLLARGGHFKARLKEVIADALRDQWAWLVTDWQREMTRFYSTVYGFNLDLTGVEFPVEQPGFGWALAMPKGFTANRIWAKCKDRFPCRSYLGSKSYLGDNLDAFVSVHDRLPTKTYVKRFRDCVEADIENEGLSANDLAKRAVSSITLPERLQLEVWYEWKTGRHLDRVTSTLCAGSRDSDGYVPYADCGDREFIVNCCSPDAAGGRLRSRSVV